MITAYPLTWPAGQPRTPAHKVEHSKFRSTHKSPSSIQREMLMEIQRLGGKNLIVSTNIPIRNDGLPYARPPIIRDYGVAVYFDLEKKPMVFACDKWASIPENMRAITKTIEALRGIERWGSGDMMRQAFTGFQALPAPMEMKPHWTTVLGLPASATIEEIDKAYKTLCMDYHHKQKDITSLNVARDESKAEKSR